jgi:transposase
MPPVDRKRPTRAESSESRYSIMEFKRDFPDDDACLEWLWRRRFAPDGHTASCPKCRQPRRFHRLTNQPAYSCDICGWHLHPTAGTIFHKSSTALWLWFYAMYLMSSTRSGISAKQLERQIGVTYKTAWRMLNRIRNKLMTEDGLASLSGEVEADETYMGGTRRGQQRHPGRPKAGSHKTPVFGIAERGGQVVAKVTPDTKVHTLEPVIRGHVLPRSIIYTDEHHSYQHLGKRGYVHRRIPHAQKVYVTGSVHTNTIEGFFSLMKNGIQGTYHSVSRKWLQGYLDEFAWRYNHRSDKRAQFTSLLLRACET